MPQPNAINAALLSADAGRAYVGTELPLFARAARWKTYFGRELARYVRGDVLEVGAGFGGTSPFLTNPTVRSWTALEPDPKLAVRLGAYVRQAGMAIEPVVRTGTLQDLPVGSNFDCITYIDVLEHIKQDVAELALAASFLRPGGFVIVLSPAYPWLFSAFDDAVGHYRRYTAKSLRAVGPPNLSPLRFFYLDAMGMAASLANRVLLRQASPTIAQVEFWDQRIVPISRAIDPFLLRSCGRSVIGVWHRSGSAGTTGHQST